MLGPCSGSGASRGEVSPKGTSLEKYGLTKKSRDRTEKGNRRAGGLIYTPGAIGKSVLSAGTTHEAVESLRALLGDKQRTVA